MKKTTLNPIGQGRQDNSLSRYLTWGEVKKQVESQGVKDGDGIQFVDILGLSDPVRCKPVPVFLRERPAWEIFQ